MSKEQSILIQNASEVYTGASRERNVDILVVGNKIAEIGEDLGEGVAGVETIDAYGKVVVPGFVNTHHHTFQAFMRHHLDLQSQPIDKWIAKVAELSRKMDPDAHRHAAMVNMAELMLYGCTTTSDHLYVYPDKYDDHELFEAAVDAARVLGMRFHPFRGSMSEGPFGGDLLQGSDRIVESTKDAIDAFHDPHEEGMVKVGIAPSTIFTNGEHDYLRAAEMATYYDVNLQTHASESRYEQEYTLDKFGATPIEFLQNLGWNTSAVSFVHCIEVSDREVGLIVEHDCSVCHCPISNSRQPIGQSGIAPIYQMLKAGVNVSIGVDGSAGNDSSNVLEEMRWARTLQGASGDSTYLSADQALYMATMGGARALRWDSAIGSIEPGKLADIAIFDVHGLESVGSWDRVGSLTSTQARHADTVMINGRVVVSGGHLVDHDEQEIAQLAWGKWEEVFGNG